MAIYQECSRCHTRQGRKNKKCRKCGNILSKDRKKVYYVGFRPVKGGKEKLEKIGTNLEEARNREAEILQRQLSGYEREKNKNAKITLGNLLDWYLGLNSVQKKASYQRDQQYSKHLLRVIGPSTVIELINQIKLEEYQFARSQEPSTTRKGRSVAPATIDKELQCLRAALNKGIEAKLISSNPIKTLPQFNKDNSRGQDISHEEFMEFLGYLPLYMQHIVTIAYWLGMRQGEITNLTWNKVDLKKRVIRLTAMDTKEKRKKMIVIFDEVYDLISQLPLDSRESRVFLRSGRAFSYDGGCNHHWNKACQLANIEDFTFHDLRHMAITRMIIEGYPLSFIMRMTGHTNFETHLRYANLNEDRMWEIVEGRKTKEIKKQ